MKILATHKDLARSEQITAIIETINQLIFPEPSLRSRRASVKGRVPPRLAKHRTYISPVLSSHRNGLREAVHHYLKHPDNPELRVTVPVHGSDLKRRTLMSIIDQAGLSVEEFLELL